nr:restriction endonuclease subunit S [Nanchangia anserum]
MDDIFDLRYGQSLELNSLTQVDAPDGVNFVSRARGNNGVTARVLPPGDVGRAGEITVALSGGVLSSFVQPEDFVTGFHVMILTAKDPAMTLVEKLWWCRCIWENRRRFSYGRQANRTLGSLLMPEACPGWASAKEVPSNDALADGYQSRISLARRNTWLDFRLDELFTLKKGKRVTKADRIPGATRFIGASEKNNGITDLCDLQPIFEAGTLTVPYNGSVGFAFYQDEPYWASDDVQVLIPNSPVDKWALLFVSTMIRFEKDRFTYGYKWNLARMKATTIHLPATPAGDPDWDHMSAYMRGLPFSAAVARSEEA